jgi:hypothetical protein
MALMAARTLAATANRLLAGWIGAKDDSAVTQALERLEAMLLAVENARFRGLLTPL